MAEIRRRAVATFIHRYGLISAAMFLVGCATVQDFRWQRALSSDSIEAYEKFLERYPTGSRADSARSRIEIGDSLAIDALIGALRTEKVQMARDEMVAALQDLSGLGYSQVDHWNDWWGRKRADYHTNCEQ